MGMGSMSPMPGGMGPGAGGVGQGMMMGPGGPVRMSAPGGPGGGMTMNMGPQMGGGIINGGPMAGANGAMQMQCCPGGASSHPPEMNHVPCGPTSGPLHQHQQQHQGGPANKSAAGPGGPMDVGGGGAMSMGGPMSMTSVPGASPMGPMSGSGGPAPGEGSGGGGGGSMPQHMGNGGPGSRAAAGNSAIMNASNSAGNMNMPPGK